MIALPSVLEALSKFVVAELYTDKGTAAQLAEVRRLQDQRFKSVALPLYLVLDAQGNELGRLGGTITEAQFLQFLAEARSKVAATPR